MYSGNIHGELDAYTGKGEGEAEAADRVLAYAADIQAGKMKGKSGHPEPNACFEPKNVKAFLKCCNAMYVKHSSPRRLASQLEMYSRVTGTEGVAVDIEHGWESLGSENKLVGGSLPQHMISIASANVLQKNTLQKAASYLGLHNLTVLRAHLDVVSDGDNGHVTMNRILVSPESKDATLDWATIRQDLKYLKWVDDRVLDLALRYKDIPMAKAEVIIAYANMLHGVLAREDSYAYALPRIFSIVTKSQNVQMASSIADIFLSRFDPKNPMQDAEFNKACEDIKGEIRKTVVTEDAITVLEKMVDAVQATLRTNKYVEDRYALALRMDPKLMGYGTVGTDIPYGVFFIHGRRFNGFHVRFRDISRGGLRVVAPNNSEQHSFESSRQYNEAYNLAFAQQLKNKDIPEGGSKAVLLVVPKESTEFANDRDFVIRKSVKAFSDALLDLNTTDESVKSKVVDYYGKDELIYLGPDENIIPSDIVWMTKRAGARKYPVPRAFISSKPDAGINHKVYGVTSEGVAVFAEEALLSQGYDPANKPFTVKITGGTDGDVAGNMIKILHREYGSNFNVVGICDGTAVVENPDGLDTTELLRLVDEELPLSAYNASKCGSNGTFHLADNVEGIKLRNTMHNRVKADLFVPAGGRPNTINEYNWREYLDADGNASSKLIVEGANLFITPEARQSLFDEAGVVIVKDSSANKCGVVCSSYEIIASMLLETPEFLKMKDNLVNDVVGKLRNLARVEAQLMFREYLKDPTSALPPHSIRISRAIIRMHDAILESLNDVESFDDNSEMLSLIKDHLPAQLQELGLQRLNTVPLPYLKCIVAASLASKIVYREGLQYTESIPASTLANVASAYLTQEHRIHEIVHQIQNSKLENADEISDLLLRGGIRAGIEKLN